VLAKRVVIIVQSLEDGDSKVLCNVSMAYIYITQKNDPY
jgi:hypothetical protein